MFFNKDKNKVEKSLTPVEKWVEVKGYKAVSKNLTSFYDNGFVYNINEPNYCEGKIELCKTGLHFCSKLEDINKYAPILESRIFEVVAIVDENSRLTTKSLTFVRELSEEEVYEKFKDTFIGNPTYFNMINSIEDFKTLRFKTREELKSLSITKHYQTLVAAGYSKAYAKILISSLFLEGIYNTNGGIDIGLFNLAIAYAEEGLSPDIRAYLLASKLK